MQSHPSKEPARERSYRRLYIRTKHQLDRLDDTVNYLLTRIDRLEARLDECKHDKDGQKAA